MKIVKLNSSQFDKFASSHKYRNYYQSSMYGNVIVKFGYHAQYLGIVNDENKLIGATLIIYKEVFMGNKMAYAPRGILFNYEDAASVKEMASKLKKTLGKQGFMLLRIDPYIPLTIRDSDGNIMNFNNQGNAIVDNLIKAGFSYRGKTLFFETEKPRWEALVILQRDIREIFAKLDKRTRNKIRRATNSGLIVEKDQDKDINALYNFVGHKDHKPISYYKEICNKFESSVEIYYAKLDTESFLINSRRNYEKELDYNATLSEKIQNMSIDDRDRENYLNKKMESDKLITAYKSNLLSATDLLRSNPSGLVVAGAMVIKYDNAAFLITEGTDDQYGSLNAISLIKWQLINDYNEQGLKYLNLNGIVGEFEKQNEFSGLNESKLGFNSTITEYVGEFDIVLNSFAYNLYKKTNKDK
ncbi:MAG: peptidoglycan bridge formation glycyltransferase FemA/FemB family protein [Bacilli bacterium]|nr:peptidoglycan bridge formation glycyltransferase FemA/FemB family protein [Bacilli bacterium]MBQ6404514.1 peptidoglycan bridge formation glycyltransferase FemA/FemB family protein [Bacilli bacterium]